MLYAVYAILILLFTLPLLAEVRMILRSMLTGSVGRTAGAKLLAELSVSDRLTLRGIRPHLQPDMLRPYGQYMRLQLLVAGAAVCAILLEWMFISQLWGIPALILGIAYCIGAFGAISLIHAHADYDPEKHTTRYDRPGK